MKNQSVRVIKNFVTKMNNFRSKYA